MKKEEKLWLYEQKKRGARRPSRSPTTRETRNHYIPRQFGYLSERGVPIVSIIFGFLIGCLMFLPFPGWQVLVGFIVSAAVMGYAMVPLAFIVANLVIYWTGWDILWKLLIAIGFVLLAIGHIVNPSELTPTMDWRSGSWLWPYLGGMAVVSYI